MSLGSQRKDEITTMLRQTLEDRRLSRGEKQALKGVVMEYSPDKDELALWRHQAFEVARECDLNHEARQVLEWLEDVLKILRPVAKDTRVAEAHFSPGPSCRNKIAHLLRDTRKTADICVFTITDDRLAGPILDAHARGVTVRVLSDDDKAYDPGSDVRRLADAGIEVRVDDSEHHMHHKFALFDGLTLVTGSYNWTRSAADHNQENVVVTDEPRLVGAYTRSFEDLWQRFRPRTR